MSHHLNLVVVAEVIEEPEQDLTHDK